MTTYQITVENKGQKSHDFLLYAEKPDIGDGGIDVLQAAMAHQTIPPGGRATFNFTHTLYVICGDSKIDHGVLIEQFQCAPEPIILGKAGSPEVLGSTYQVYVQSEAAAFTVPGPAPSAKAGAFRIITGSDFEDKSNVYAGIASKDASGNGLTVNATFSLEPSARYSIRPKLVFYIATGRYKPGKLLDIGELGDPVQVNYEGGTSVAVVTYNPNGTYTGPQYSNS